MYSFDKVAKTVTKVEDMMNAYFVANSITDIANTLLEVSDGCVAFRINDFVYRKDQTASATPFFAIDASTSTWTDPDFDESFKIAINANKLYMHDGSAYVELITSTFKTKNDIYLNEAMDRIVVRSYDVVSATEWTVVIKYYAKNQNNIWQDLDLGLSKTVFVSLMGTLKFSPDFSYIGFGWINTDGIFKFMAKHIKADTLEIHTI